MNLSRARAAKGRVFGAFGPIIVISLFFNRKTSIFRHKTSIYRSRSWKATSQWPPPAPEPWLFLAYLSKNESMEMAESNFFYYFSEFCI